MYVTGATAISAVGAAQALPGALRSAAGAAASPITTTTRAITTAVRGRGFEVVERAMSPAELRATVETGLLRGGRAGTHYVSDAVNNDAIRARLRLALPRTPEVKVTLEVPRGRFSAPRTVRPAFGMMGGGTERVATGALRVTIKKVRYYWP